MINGIMVTWFTLTALSVLFVAIDIWRNTPEATVMKWAFIILTVFTGPFGAFFYVLGCREPIKGMHEQYVSVRWRQVLGSTMHCAAGDGVGIVVGAALGSALAVTFWSDFALEYVLGFGFGWAFFQAFAMRDMAGGSYTKSLRMTFFPEFLSMNVLMAGMQIAMALGMMWLPAAHHASSPEFWFVASMSLIVGFMFSYPMNWWLVANHMKHGMMTVRKEPVAAAAMASHDMGGSHYMSAHSETMGDMDSHMHSEMGTGPTQAAKFGMTVLSLAVLIIGVFVAHQVSM